MATTQKTTESSIQNRIGSNLRLFRKIAGLTQSEFADEYLVHSGTVISSATVGAWERGEKNMTASQLYYCAMVLGVLEQSLYGSGTGFKVENPVDFAHVMKLAEKWDGNKKALLQLIALYMSCDKHYRADIAGMGVMMYRRAAKEGHLRDDAIPVDVEYLESEWVKLIK